MSNCKDCRFYADSSCARFNVPVSESCAACDTFVPVAPLVESANMKIQLND
jgi:hypothetical protein